MLLVKWIWKYTTPILLSSWCRCYIFDTHTHTHAYSHTKKGIAWTRMNRSKHATNVFYITVCALDTNTRTHRSISPFTFAIAAPQISTTDLRKQRGRMEYKQRGTEILSFQRFQLSLFWHILLVFSVLHIAIAIEMYKGMHAPAQNTMPKIDIVAKKKLADWLAGVDFVWCVSMTRETISQPQRILK